VLTAALGCGWAAVEGVVGVIAAAGGWLAGLGELSWKNPEGTWIAVDPAAARRREWGPTDAFLRPDWRTLAPGLELAEVPLRRSPNPQPVDLVLTRADPARWEVRVAGREDWAGDTVAGLADEAGLVVAVNASYFSDEGPLGLVVSDGVRRHRAVSHRAAHFLVRDGRVRIVNQRKADTTGVDQGFQGFPAIMSGGRTYAYMRVGGRGFDVWEVDRRSAGCVDRQGRVLFLATDSFAGGLSFDELATVLGGLGCVDAMGFDGGTSTGMMVHVGSVWRSVLNYKPVPVVVGLSSRE